MAVQCFSAVMRKVRDQKTEVRTLSFFISASKHDHYRPFYRRGEVTFASRLTDTGLLQKI